MTIENTDYLLVNKGDKSYKIEYGNVKVTLNSVDRWSPRSSENGTQYGRQDGDMD